MPRTKGSKNRPKTNNDYASQITEKQETIVSLNTEIASIQKAIEEQKNTLKEKKSALEKAEKEVASLEAKKAKADAKAAEEAKKTEAEAVLKKLLASGMSANEILDGYCGKSGVESKMGNSPDSTKGGLNYDQTD